MYETDNIKQLSYYKNGMREIKDHRGTQFIMSVNMAQKKVNDYIHLQFFTSRLCPPDSYFIYCPEVY